MCAAIARALPLFDEPDTAVVDVEDLTVQVQLFDAPNVWHRKMIGGDETACGRGINYRLASGNVLEQRMERYSGRLCTDGCFSPHELRLSMRANALAFVPDSLDD